MLADEVFFGDFKNRRELAGYFGLVSESLEQRRGEPRSRACRLGQSPSAADGARTGLAVGVISPTARLRGGSMSASAPARAVRKTMIVAMARKPMIALWKFLTLGVILEGAVVKS